jgi:alpha-1,2-mannosyltransferase
VPWNIVAYNVFSGSSKGPNIYGTEPWHYYIRNLILNFGVWFPLALVTIPLILLQHIVGSQPVSHASILRTLTYASPLYLWLGIFTIQPHKEERFMFPVYPLIALNAAISFHIALQTLGHISTFKILPRIPPMVKFTAVTAFIFAALAFSFLRSASLATGYTAPLRVYSPLTQLANSGDTVCLGKEWYRFPSSYFLPQGVRAKFIKSAFTGLLPGEYSEAKNRNGLWSGTSLIPKGMNDENKEDPSKYVSLTLTHSLKVWGLKQLQVDISECTFLVDSHFTNANPSTLEPDYVLDTANWERVACEPFLDSQTTGLLGRLFWLPNSKSIPGQLRRQWGDYCLLRHKTVSR